MRVSEGIAAAYFAYLLAAGWWLPVPGPRRRRLTLVAMIVVTAIVALAHLPPSFVVSLARDWAPGLYILAGYWLSGLFFVRADRPLEAWLASVDRRLFASAGVRWLVERAPRAVLEYFELSYLFCYALVPAGFATLYAAGRYAEADRFWTAVLGATLACYGFLPWIATRSPRDVEPSGLMAGLWFRRLNLALLARASIHVNTLPSGHAAGALATALAVAAVLPLAGAVFAMIAASIIVASVLGRYHYAVDAVLGVLVAVAAFVVSRI